MDERRASARFDEELLRAVVSGLGSAQEDGKGRLKYVRGYDCEGCLDDMRRLLHRDDADSRSYFRTLGKWDVVRSDLAPLLCNCPSENQLVFKILKVLVYLTMPLEPESSNLAEQRSYLQSFKAPLLEGECLGIIVSVVMEPLSAHPDMGEEDAQTVQLVLTLFRNLLRITDAVATAASGSHHKTRMRELMIQRFFDENVMELFLLCAQYSDAPPFDEEGLLLLEIFDELFRGIDPCHVVLKRYGPEALPSRAKDSEEGTSSGGATEAPAASILDRIRLDQGKRTATGAPLRHSRFSGVYTKKFSDGGRSIARRDHTKPMPPAKKLKPKTYSKAKKNRLDLTKVDCDEPDEVLNLQSKKTQRLGEGRALTSRDLNSTIVMNKKFADRLHEFIMSFLQDSFNVMMPPLIEDDLRELPGVFEDDGGQHHLRLMRLLTFLLNFFIHQRSEEVARAGGKEPALTYASIGRCVTLKTIQYGLRLWHHCAEVPPANDEKDWPLQEESMALLSTILRILRQVDADGSSRDKQVVEVWQHQLLYDMTEAGLLPLVHLGLKRFDRNRQSRKSLVDLVMARQIALNLLQKMTESATVYGGLQVLRKKRHINKRKTEVPKVDAETDAAADVGADAIAQATAAAETGVPDGAGDPESVPGAHLRASPVRPSEPVESDAGPGDTTAGAPPLPVGDGEDGAGIQDSGGLDTAGPGQDNGEQRNDDAVRGPDADGGDAKEITGDKGIDAEPRVKDDAHPKADPVEVEEDMEMDGPLHPAPAPKLVEQVLNLRKEKIRMLDANVVSHLAWILRGYQNNPPDLNNHVADALRQIVDPAPHGLDLAPMTWQLSLLQTCYRIMTDGELRRRKSRSDRKLMHLASKITSSFFVYLMAEQKDEEDPDELLAARRASAGKMMFLEVLFWKGRRRADEILTCVKPAPKPKLRVEALGPAPNPEGLGDDDDEIFNSTGAATGRGLKKEKKGRGLLTIDEEFRLCQVYDRVCTTLLDADTSIVDPMAEIVSGMDNRFTSAQLTRQLKKLGKDCTVISKRKRKAASIRGARGTAYESSSDDDDFDEDDGIPREEAEDDSGKLTGAEESRLCELYEEHVRRYADIMATSWLDPMFDIFDGMDHKFTRGQLRHQLRRLGKDCSVLCKLRGDAARKAAEDFDPFSLEYEVKEGHAMFPGYGYRRFGYADCDGEEQFFKDPDDDDDDDFDDNGGAVSDGQAQKTAEAAGDDGGATAPAKSNGERESDMEAVVDHANDGDDEIENRDDAPKQKAKSKRRFFSRKRQKVLNENVFDDLVEGAAPGERLQDKIDDIFEDGMAPRKDNLHETGERAVRGMRIIDSDSE